MKKVLVVDDNIDAAKTLSLLLKALKHETVVAHDGLEAVSAAETFRPDLILLDISLPKLNGPDVCRRIREEEWGENLPIIALSGLGLDDERRRAEGEVFSGHLVKPISLPALQELLAGLPA